MGGLSFVLQAFSHQLLRKGLQPVRHLESSESYLLNCGTARYCAKNFHKKAQCAGRDDGGCEFLFFFKRGVEGDGRTHPGRTCEQVYASGEEGDAKELEILYPLWKNCWFLVQSRTSNTLKKCLGLARLLVRGSRICR